MNLTKWAHLLNATGGTLNPSKCYWYMIANKYHKERWVFNDKPPSGNLTIPLPDGTDADHSPASIGSQEDARSMVIPGWE